ncbi:glycosyltransferase family 4 protein [Aquimarina intermedia]|uniref:Glycosyltransferase involved in cell wall biosynthesis n=1 Tax=Aquimarina intermedia TaxID=350814 RepID=A0A5S5CAC7_9FLAO|nr:glycosyltransferase family 4 protein [Aquimarina intermedia]TYP74943.1 glycosyltransferase involved in cell wall biosynthesis [Aquimarina intermedia]
MLKVLIITYYWPPAGGPGVQRWLKFVKYLRDFDIEPIVYCPQNPSYPLLDDTLEKDIPKDITILKKPIFEPYRFAEVFSKSASTTISKGIIVNEEKQSLIQKLLLYIRGNFFIPDARKFWVRSSVKYLDQYLQTKPIDILITTGPPHSVHLIGKELKKKIGLPWLADFRDPWTTIGYHKKLKLSKRAAAKHKKLESAVLNAADRLLVTSYTTAKEFKTLTNKPISVITNGYDEYNYSEVELDKNFTISHIGSLLSGRNPIQLWQALYDLTIEDEDFAKFFKLQLIGATSPEVLESLQAIGLLMFIEDKGYVSHQEALKLQKSSQVLLLIEIDSKETECIIPGKLFEYMVSKRPILAIGPKNADIRSIIMETETGSFFEYDSYNLIKEQLKKYFDLYQNQKLSTKPVGLEKYSRKSLTQNLAQVLKQMI